MSEAEVKYGLAGVLADDTSVSKVMPEINSLTYRGYKVQDLATACRFEEVAYLIWNGELPTKAQLDAFNAAEKKERGVSEDLYKAMRLFNPNAHAAVAYTTTRLSAQDLRWLADLPHTATTDDCEISHGTLHQPERFDYIQSTKDADPSLDLLERPVCFVGHTHVPVAIMRLVDSPHRTSYTIDRRIELADSTVALVNVGSVGQPRDEDPRAAYAVYDTDDHSVTIRRIEYDVDREADRILRAGLPKMLADRLFLGI